MSYDKTLLSEVIELRNTNPDMTWEQLADHVFKKYKIFLTGDALRKRTARFENGSKRLELAEDLTFPIPFVKEYNDSIDVPYQDTMVLSDVHLPFYDPRLAERAIKIAKKFNIKTVVIPGDLLDMKAMSRYMSFHDGDSDAAEYELEMAERFIQALTSWFTTIYIFTGNHERRIEDRLERKIGFRTLFRMALRDVDTKNVNIVVSNYPYMKMRGKDGLDIMFGHPDSYSRTKGKVPLDLATKYQCNLVTGHTHHAVITTHPSNRYWIMEAGCLADPAAQEYLAYSLTTMPFWTKAFGMIKNEVPYLFFDNPLLTDWGYWLGGNDESS